MSAFLAIAASLAQVHRYQVKSPAENIASGNVRTGDAVSPAGGGSGAGPGESAGQISRKNGSLPRKGGSLSRKDEPLSRKDGSLASQTDGPSSRKDGGSLSQKEGSSEANTDGSLHNVGQQGAVTRGVSPPPIALTNRGDAFEGAITRLAGAAELGTESLIYVRRADVAEIIDALMDHARAFAESGVASPALARLSIMRRSRRREGRGKRRNGRGRRPTCSPEVLVIEGARASSIGHGQSSLSPASSFFGIAKGSEGELLKEGSVPAAAAAAVPDGKSRVFIARPLLQAGVVMLDDDATAPVRRTRGGGRGGEQGRWRPRTRSPPPPASFTPVAMIQKAAPPSITASTTVEVPRTEIEIPRTEIEVPRTEIKRGPASACGTTSGKISRVPIRPVAAGKGADFEDFWGSGWG